jgi:hypothetical protein
MSRDIYMKSHDEPFNHPSNTKGTTTTILEPSFLVLMMIYRVCHLRARR